MITKKCNFILKYIKFDNHFYQIQITKAQVNPICLYLKLRNYVQLTVYVKLYYLDIKRVIKYSNIYKCNNKLLKFVITEFVEVINKEY